MRALYPDRRLTVAFQPHLYTRTRDFAPAFAEALSQADEVILLPIYPAREKPIEGVDSNMIFKDVTSPVKFLLESRTDLPGMIDSRGFDVLLTAGAGDIVDPLPEIVSNVKS